MTTYTNSDWVTHILRKSSIVGEDENPTAAQSDEAQRIINSRVAFLAIDGITMWNGSMSGPIIWRCIFVKASAARLQVRMKSGQRCIRCANCLQNLQRVRPWQKTTCISK